MCVCVCVFNLNSSYCAIKKLSTHMLPEIYMYIYIFFFFSVSHTHLKWNTVRHQQWLSQGGRPSVIYFNASFCLSNFLPWELKLLLLKTKKQLKVWEEMYLPQLTFVLAKEDGKTQNTVFIILAGNFFPEVIVYFRQRKEVYDLRNLQLWRKQNREQYILSLLVFSANSLFLSYPSAINFSN